jgi:hypothetical protein
MVRTIQTATPRPELREFVRIYAQREITCDGAGFAQANTAVLEQVLAFELGDRTVLDGLSIAHEYGYTSSLMILVAPNSDERLASDTPDIASGFHGLRKTLG